MPEWEYLTTEPFQARHAIAAHIIDSSAYYDVVEIGCYRIPIARFLRRNYNIIMCDTTMEEEKTEFTPLGRRSYWPGQFQEYMDYFPESDFGLVALGMEIKGDFEPFIELVNRSKITVVELPVNWEPSQKQFERILSESNKQVKMQIGLDFSNNDFRGLKGYPVRPHRIMYALR